MKVTGAARAFHHVDDRARRPSKALFNYLGAELSRGVPCVRQGCTAQAVAEALLPRRVAERIPLCRTHATEAVQTHGLDAVLTDFQRTVQQTWMELKFVGGHAARRPDEDTFMRLLRVRNPRFHEALPYDVRASLRHLQLFGFCMDWRDPGDAPASSLAR